MDLKQLKALLKIMRNEGVLSLKTSEVDIQLSSEAILPTKAQHHTVQDSNEVSSDNPYNNFPDGVLTDTQLAFYSAGGDPSEDPENQSN
jgi:hypothetical protein